MAISRYKQKNIAATTGGGIVAEAKAQAAASIGQRVQAFQGIALENYKQDVIADASVDADRAYSAEQEDLKLIKDTVKEGDKAFMFGGDHSRLQKENTIYARTFNSRLNALNKNSKIIKANDAANGFYDTNLNNANGYSESFDAMSQALLRDTSDTNKPEMSLELSSMKASHLGKINRTYIAEQKAIQVETNNQINIKNAREYESTTYYNHPKQALLAKAKYVAEINSLVRDGQLTP